MKVQLIHNVIEVSGTRHSDSTLLYIMSFGNPGRTTKDSKQLAGEEAFHMKTHQSRAQLLDPALTRGHQPPALVAQGRVPDN